MFPRYMLYSESMTLLQLFFLQIYANIISDVLGKITAVSNPAVVRNTAGDLMMRRIIKLQDLRYIFSPKYLISNISIPNMITNNTSIKQL